MISPTALQDHVQWIAAVARVSPRMIGVFAGLPRTDFFEAAEGDDTSARAASVAALARSYGCTADWLVGLDPVGPTRAQLRRACVEIGLLAAPTPRVRVVDPLRDPSRSWRRRLRSVLITPVPPEVAERRARCDEAERRWSGDVQLPRKAASMMALKDRLVLLLEGSQISQAELARVAGLNVTHVSDLCRGRSTNVTVRTLVAIACSLGCSTDWLLGLQRNGPSLMHVRTAFAAAGGRVYLHTGQEPDAPFAENVTTTSRRGRVRRAPPRAAPRGDDRAPTTR